MSKQAKTNRADPTGGAAPVMTTNTAESSELPAAAQVPAEPAAAAPPTGAVARALAFAERRLQGTRVERLARRATEAAGKLPALAQRELDAALDRLGLVRKSKAAQGSPVAVVTVSAIKPA